MLVHTVRMLSSLGFCAHPVKSVFIPTQQLIFLGFILNSVTITVTPTDEEREKLVFVFTPNIREVTELIGTLVLNFQGAEFGPLHYCSLEKKLIFRPCFI